MEEKPLVWLQLCKRTELKLADFCTDTSRIRIVIPNLKRRRRGHRHCPVCPDDELLISFNRKLVGDIFGLTNLHLIILVVVYSLHVHSLDCCVGYEMHIMYYVLCVYLEWSVLLCSVMYVNASQFSSYPLTTTMYY